MTGRKVKVSLEGKDLFTGTEGPGSPPWLFWHRVTPDGHIDLPPMYKVEPLEEVPPVTQDVILRDAIRERDERISRAGRMLSEELRTAQRHYEQEIAEATRMYKVRLGE